MITTTTAQQIRDILDTTTLGAQPVLPGVVYLGVNSHGDEFFKHASGNRGLGCDDPMTLDTVFWLASFTKVLTGISCMQLVEQGVISLDSADEVEKVAPELAKVQVLEKDERNKFYLAEKNERITLRMLLNHTAGFGYAFEDLKLAEWSLPTGLDDFWGCKEEILSRPLVNQPGTKFQYGTSVDWAGVIVERLSQLSLEQYFRKFILDKVGVRDVTFFPNQELKSKLAFMHQRAVDDSLSVRDHVCRAALLAVEESTGERFCMGGCGCFGKPVEFCKIFSTLLNNGTSPSTGVQILKPETVNEMFTDQIPTTPRYANEYTPSAKPLLAKPCPLVPVPDDLTEGWGLTFSLSHQASATGRPAGTASWEGMPNLFWYADRKNGIATIIATQILPFGDLKVIETSDAIEKLIYDDILQKASSAVTA